MTVLYHAPGELVEVKPEGSPRTYRLRVPKHLERPRWRHRIAALGGRRWGQLDLARALRDAVGEVLPSDADAAERENLQAQVGAYVARMEEALAVWRAERTAEADAALAEALAAPPEVVAIEAHVVAASPAYAAKLADRVAYRELAGIAAAEIALAGWEGPGLPEFRRTLAGVPEELLGHIPSREFVALGDRMETLVDPPEELLGNSGPGSPGSSTPDSSTATRTPPPSGPSSTSTGSPPG